MCAPQTATFIQPGCRLSPASLLADVEEAGQRGMAVEFLRLHRVLTDAVVVEGAAGAFGYTIDIGG